MRRRTFLGGALAAFAGETARVDSDGMLLVDGRRTFVLGLYQLPRGPDAWRRAAEAGFHVVHADAKPDQLAQARAHKMHVWLTAGSKRGPRDETRIRKFIGRWKQYPEVLFWETEDEPSFVWKKPKEFRVPPEVIRETYRLIKSVDAARPVYLNHAPTNLASTLARYNPGGDLIATDIYPVVPHGIRELYALWPDGRQGDFLNSTISQVGSYTDKMRQVAGPGRGVWMVLQGFAWEMLREKDRDPKMIRYPSPAETRFMAFQAIVHGAAGLLWWGLHTTPEGAGLWESIAAVARELTGLSRELAERPLRADVQIEYHDTGHSLDRGIEWVCKPSGKGSVLIAVNADRNPVEVTMRSGGWRHRELFEPFGVRVFRP